jgi:hypothetical protein
MGIENKFLNQPDIITTSPHYLSINGVDTILGQSINTFINGFEPNCNPIIDSLFGHYAGVNSYYINDYRAIALVDTISPLIEYKVEINASDNNFEVNCAEKPDLYKKVNAQMMYNIQPPLSISPNPTNGIVYISNTNWINASVVDIVGKPLLYIENSVSIVDMSKLKSGIYIINFNMKDGSIQQFKVLLE